MRARRAGFIFSFLAIAYVSIAGCGDDDSSSPIADGADTGVDGSTQSGQDGNVSKADTSSNADTSTTADTSVSDTSTADVTNDARSPEFTGSTCKMATDCYQTLDAQALKGATFCIDKVTDGYCTHECVTDDDCCAIEGECKTKLKQVCATFENTGKKLCVLSCEADDIKSANDAGLSDAGATDYCEKNISSEFSCRSTGGGSGNKKACLPNGGGPTDAGSDADAGDASLDALDAADADGG